MLVVGLAGCAPRVVCTGELTPGLVTECTCVDSCEQTDAGVTYPTTWCTPHCYAFAADGGEP
ncbi:MAG: hypothetical protein QM817_10420 [Archangium sp.]